MTPGHRLAVIVAVVASAACVVLLLLLLTGSSRQAQGGQPAKRAAAPPPATVQVRRTKLGRILTDQQGRTLYRFDEDSGGRSTCFAGCANVWPPALVTGRPIAGAGVSARRLTTVRRGRSDRQ